MGDNEGLEYKGHKVRESGGEGDTHRVAKDDGDGLGCTDGGGLGDSLEVDAENRVVPLDCAAVHMSLLTSEDSRWLEEGAAALEDLEEDDVALEGLEEDGGEEKYLEHNYGKVKALNTMTLGELRSQHDSSSETSDSIPSNSNLLHCKFRCSQ